MPEAVGRIFANVAFKEDSKKNVSILTQKP